MNKIHLDKNSFHGQGELKLIFASIDEIEILETKLKLYSKLKELFPLLSRRIFNRNSFNSLYSRLTQTNLCLQNHS